MNVVVNTKNTAEKTGWSDSRKFWAETWRTILFGAIGALLTVRLVNHAAARDNALIGTQMTLRSKSVEEFITASRQYTVAAGEFCASGTNAGKFESDDVDSFRTSLMRVRAYFSGREAVTKQADMADNLSNELFRKCDGNPDQSKTATWRNLKKTMVDADTELASEAIKELGN